MSMLKKRLILRAVVGSLIVTFVTIIKSANDNQKEILNQIKGQPVLDMEYNPIKLDADEGKVITRKIVSTSSSIGDAYFNATSNQPTDLVNSKEKLPAGKGLISGVITINQVPITGVRVSLYVAEHLITESSITNAAGEYHISLPNEKYKITGYYIEVYQAKESFPGQLWTIDRSQIEQFPITINLDKERVIGPNFNFSPFKNSQ